MTLGTPRTNSFRVLISGLIAVLVTLTVILTLTRVALVDIDGSAQLLVTSYVVAWPLNVVIYAAWTFRAYARLDPAALRQAAGADDRSEQRFLQRMLGTAGATDTTVLAAIIALTVTIGIAQRPEFRGEAIYIALALLTVASSWVLMVFSFAQSYLRLGVGERQQTHLRFIIREPARFTEYLTLAVTISAFAATAPAEATSRRAWRIVRTNVIIAFVFNSVIIAMMVSLLFSGIRP